MLLAGARGWFLPAAPARMAVFASKKRLKPGWSASSFAFFLSSLSRAFCLDRHPERKKNLGVIGIVGVGVLNFAWCGVLALISGLSLPPLVLLLGLALRRPCAAPRGEGNYNEAAHCLTFCVVPLELVGERLVVD